MGLERPHLPMLEQHEHDHTTCAFCPKLCRFACPVSEAEPRESLTPWGKMTLLHVVAEGSHPLEPSTAAAFWGCTGCMRCRTHCLHRNEVADALRSGRAVARRAGLEPSEAAAAIEGFAAREERACEAAAALDQGKSDARVAYMPGCTAVLSQRDDVAATLRLLETVADGPVCVEAGACCGLPLLNAGDEIGFRRAAETLGRRLASRSTVLVGDPGCAFALKVLYPRRGIYVPAEPVVLSEYVAVRLPRLGSKARPRDVVAAYHDPCNLGRGLGVYDAPRTILRRLVSELRELPHSRDDSECCGGGGGLPDTMPDAARRIAARRLEDANEIGADVLVTACPSCKRQLGNAEPDVEIRDLFELASSLVT
ncbi:MAG: (Fe-S)-binding protein [Deltaproteobacteria bacterium]|nr:(Fe-S)-binding protein [Deltaproteobacteria bacterium]